MSDLIKTLVETVADDCGGVPEDFVGQTVRDMLTKFESQGGHTVLWALYDDATLATVIGPEHI